MSPTLTSVHDLYVLLKMGDRVDEPQRSFITHKLHKILAVRGLHVPRQERALVTPMLLHGTYKLNVLTFLKDLIHTCRPALLPLAKPRGQVVEGRWRTIEDELFNLKHTVRMLDFESKPTCVCYTTPLARTAATGHIAAAGDEIARQLGNPGCLEKLLLGNASEPMFPSFTMYNSKWIGNVLQYCRDNHIGLGHHTPKLRHACCGCNNCCHYEGIEGANRHCQQTHV